MQPAWICEGATRRIAIQTADGIQPVLVQEAPENGRPYIHPLRSPEASAVLTENAPGHHPWQHGLYVGLNDVNGMGFWTEGLASNSECDGRFACRPLGPPTQSDDCVLWGVECHWSAPDGDAVLDEAQQWSLMRRGDAYVLDMTWTLTACTDLRFGQYEYGGLFLRMPYRSEVGGRVLTSAGQAFPEAEGQRARWAAVWMPIEGERDGAGIAIMDHSGNAEHPVPWRVDGQLGISPSRCIAAAWDLAAGASSISRYRIVAFSGAIDSPALEAHWEQFCQE